MSTAISKTFEVFRSLLNIKNKVDQSIRSHLKSSSESSKNLIGFFFGGEQITRLRFLEEESLVNVEFNFSSSDVVVVEFIVKDPVEFNVVTLTAVGVNAQPENLIFRIFIRQSRRVGHEPPTLISKPKEPLSQEQTVNIEEASLCSWSPD